MATSSSDNSSSAHQESKESNQHDLRTATTVTEGSEGEEELKLPKGYRFKPTDKELIIGYLLNKILGRQLPANFMKHVVDLYQYRPDELPICKTSYLKKGKAYFFTHVENDYQNAMGQRLTTTGGYWEATGQEIEVIHRNAVIGFKKTLVFYHVDATEVRKSCWTSREYRLNPEVIPVNELNDNVKAEIERRVICKIRYKKSESTAEFPAASDTHDGKENQIGRSVANMSIHDDEDAPNSSEENIQVEENTAKHTRVAACNNHKSSS